MLPSDRYDVKESAVSIEEVRKKLELGRQQRVRESEGDAVTPEQYQQIQEEETKQKKREERRKRRQGKEINLISGPNPSEVSVSGNIKEILVKLFDLHLFSISKEVREVQKELEDEFSEKVGKLDKKLDLVILRLSELSSQIDELNDEPEPMSEPEPILEPEPPPTEPKSSGLGELCERAFRQYVNPPDVTDDDRAALEEFFNSLLINTAGDATKAVATFESWIAIYSQQIKEIPERRKVTDFLKFVRSYPLES